MLRLPTYNAALDRTAYASSIFIESTTGVLHPPHLANDGRRQTQLRQCAASQYELNPWWAVDLGGPQTVDRITFTNTDDHGMTFTDQFMLTVMLLLFMPL